MKPALALATLLMGCLPSTTMLCAQSTPSKPTEMNVDMPDETEETDIIDPQQWQLETALLNNRYKEGRPSLIAQALLRYGISKRVEVRALMEDGRRRDRYLSETVQSTYPLAVGTKVVLLKDKGHFPDVTFVGYLKLPFTSHDKEQQRYWSPQLLLAFQHKFANDRVKLEYNGGGQQEAFDRQWHWVANASLHYKLTQTLETFGEYYAQFSRQDIPLHNLGGGLALEIGSRVEVYLSGGSTIHIAESNYFFAGGVAVRTL